MSHEHETHLRIWREANRRAGRWSNLWGLHYWIANLFNAEWFVIAECPDGDMQVCIHTITFRWHEVTGGDYKSMHRMSTMGEALQSHEMESHGRMKCGHTTEEHDDLERFDDIKDDARRWLMGDGLDIDIVQQMMRDKYGDDRVDELYDTLAEYL